MCLLAFASPRRSDAQDIAATSFDQLRLLVRLGDVVTVTDASGHHFKGKLAGLTDTSLSLADSQVFAERDVEAISLHDHGHPQTGAWWGFGVASSFGALLAADSCGHNCGPSAVSGVLILGGLGAGIGVGISSMIATEHLVFRSGSSAARLTLTPMFSQNRQGLSMSLRF